MKPADGAQFDEMVHSLVASRKYAGMNLAEATVRDVLSRELENHRDPKTALKAARAVLHNIVAAYLGDPDYPAAGKSLERAHASGSEEAIRGAYLEILQAHISTAERIPLLPVFYPRLFEVTGIPTVIFDLACGLNPLSFLWMGLPTATQYHAYDIHMPRVNLLNQAFSLLGLQPLAEVRDILVSPPEQAADVAYLFKEAHRMEQRRKGAVKQLLEGLHTRWVLVSLPTRSLHGGHDLLERQRALVRAIVGEHNWRVVEVAFPGEMVFCIEKQTG